MVVRGNHYSVEDYLPDEHAYRLADPRGTHTIPAAQVERANGQAPRVPIPPKPTP